LAGLFIVEVGNNDLPSGKYDVPLILQDRTFDDNNQLGYLQKVKLNTTEIWEFINGDDDRGMGMMQDMMRNYEVT